MMRATRTFPGTFTIAVSMTRRSSRPPIWGRGDETRVMRDGEDAGGHAGEIPHTSTHLGAQPWLPQRILKLCACRENVCSLHT
jgi:hypothetical protein